MVNKQHAQFSDENGNIFYLENETEDVLDPSGKPLSNGGDLSEASVTFTPDATRKLPQSGGRFKAFLGSIVKFLSDLTEVAFSGNYSDLEGKPTIPPLANNCTTTAAGYGLDARQGKVLMDKANQLSSEMASITDSGAITGMDAREDGVYITYVPTAGADAVTKKLGSPELHIPEWRYVLTGGNTFLRFENPGYSKISIGSYTKNGNGSLSISIEGITSAEEFISLGGQTGTEYDIKDYPAFRIVLSSLGAINGYLRDISIV